MTSHTAFPVAVLNRSSVVSDDEAAAMIPALQQQASLDFAEVWGIDAELSFLPSDQLTGWEGKWNLVLLDTSDEANALGYHDLTPDGLPVGKVFAKSDALAGSAVSVTTSHELLEMLLDPYINLTAQDPVRNYFVAYEACDAVEADAIGYERDGILLSDFVTPVYFDPTAAQRGGEHFSFRDNVSRPFELAPGGYEIIWVPGQGWTQNVARQEGPQALDRPRVGSRRERRVTPTEQWQRSDD